MIDKFGFKESHAFLLFIEKNSIVFYTGDDWQVWL